MAEYTKNLNLKKPEPDDFVNVADLNGNFDVIDEKIAEAAEGGKQYYGTCTTAAATAAKVVTADRDFVLETGAAIDVKFSYANSAASPTLNVGGTGAKAIKKYGNTAPNTYQWYAGAMVRFVYDGTYWIMEGGTTATTTYYGVTKLNSSTSSTSTTEAATPSAVKAAMDKANAANAAAQTAAEESLPLYGGGTLESGGGDRIQIYPYDGDRPDGELAGPRIALIPGREGVLVPVTDMVISAGLSGNYIKGLDDPSAADEAANKRYVDKVAANKQNQFFGTCSTSASAAEKTVTTEENFKLKNGVAVDVYFDYSNTAANPTLNVNGTGAKYILKTGSVNIDARAWRNASVVRFIYSTDDDAWIRLDGTTASTAYYGITKLNNNTNSTSTTEAATANAVKQAFDYADAAYVMADEALVRSNEAKNTSVMSSYLAFVGNVNDEQIAAALGKNNEENVIGVGMALALYDNYKKVNIGNQNEFLEIYNINKLPQIFGYKMSSIIETIQLSFQSTSTTFLQSKNVTFKITEDMLNKGFGLFFWGYADKIGYKSEEYAKIYINNELVYDIPKDPNKTIKYKHLVTNGVDFTISNAGIHTIKFEVQNGNGFRSDAGVTFNCALKEMI